VAASNFLALLGRGGMSEGLGGKINGLGTKGSANAASDSCTEL
jgi:hypothetical protein